ncbi:FtsW/RodA/SpoVE family cell cycle protein [Bombilactobacillus folatiphilus]|uniref:Probable peptidoglycan glycosyltransferase FtsW n=1 Tax=Bombilactobacillus folatiphilus TaxID=2923362 RepID=A0ABY4PAR5_9LACO|nr:FtsW/RodA/SpoVE family cell cycle protein [Bombilactobacillus folatiphilus]UQS82736.1 FtsW/RodA/SpoVE family cell cycle protein [Bombilactobacillus folatiphilus]
MIYSASSNAALLQGLSNIVYLKRQLIYVVIGLFGCFLFYLLKIDMLKRKLFVQDFVVVVLALLFYLLLKRHFDPQSMVNGASAWIPLGPIHLQPLELAKLALILYLAKVFSARSLRIRRQRLKLMMRELFPPILLAGLIILLTLLQPDLGGAAILASIVFLLTFSSGLDMKYVLAIVLALIALFAAAYFYFKHQLNVGSHSSYKLKRLMAFYHPFELEKTGGIQLVNSYYAINNGGLFGRGLGNSIQKLGYLPEPYTDFILSIISEELGIIGVIFVLALIFVLIVRIVYVGVKANNVYWTLLCYGVATLLFVQTAFNVGGVVGLLPITGVTLPFISYGGSSQIVLSICVGICLNVSVNLKREQTMEIKEG